MDGLPRVRPRLRGVSHQYAFFVSLALGAVLVGVASTALERAATAVFAAALALMFGVSALYHRIWWEPRARRIMRRLDHSAIFLLVAGTYTPFGLLVLEGAWQVAVLGIVWTGCLLAIVLGVAWPVPKWITAAIAIAVGWVGVAAVPQLWAGIGPGGVTLIAIGGLLYTGGALVYALRRPDPVPAVFGYHEIFHALVIAAAGCQYAAVAFFALG
jgi:hemolysin III